MWQKYFSYVINGMIFSQIKQLLCQSSILWFSPVIIGFKVSHFFTRYTDVLFFQRSTIKQMLMRTLSCKWLVFVKLMDRILPLSQVHVFSQSSHIYQEVVNLYKIATVHPETRFYSIWKMKNAFQYNSCILEDAYTIYPHYLCAYIWLLSK